MISGVAVVGVALLALPWTGCFTQACTAVGCIDNFGASVQGSDGTLPSGVHRIEILADGRTFDCEFTFPTATPSLTSSMKGAPGQVHMWQYVDEVTILDAAVAPDYHEFSPNGPECGPTCKGAGVSWTLQ